MDKRKLANTPIPTCTKLSKNDYSSPVNSTLYKRIVGSLMYLIATRMDIMYGVSLISRFMESPKDSHWKVGKRILRYIVGTTDHGNWYSTFEDNYLVGYTDSAFAGNVDDRKNTFGYAFHMGTCLISWAYNKQPIVTLSLAEAEYVAMTSTTCHTIWLRRFLCDFGHEEKEPTSIFCGNNSTIALSKNHVSHHKSKHIDTHYHFI